MKQKNIILMVVAVGCGLVAAFLTSTMSAKPKTETVDVIVASKDLPVGTMITKEDLPKIIKLRKMPKDGLPPMYVQTEEEMIGMRLGRAVRVDEMFNPADLKKGGAVTIPKGFDMMSVQVGLPEAVAGFVTPGSHVDILATANARDRKIAFPLLVDMLVLAVDAATELPKDAPSFAALNTVSFAVDRQQALLLQLARSRGCQLSLVLRHPDKVTDKEQEEWKPEDVRRLLTNGTDGDDYIEGRPVKRDPNEEKEAEAKPSDMVVLPIALESLPAGQELTIDVITNKFELKNVPGPAPEGAVLKIEDLIGKHLQHPLAKDQWLPKTFVGDYAPGKSAPKDEFDPSKIGPATAPPVLAGPAKKTHDVVVASGSGHKIFRYEEKHPGSREWVLIGEVNKGDAQQGWTPAPVPAPIPEPIPEPKPEPVPTPRQD